MSSSWFLTGCCEKNSHRVGNWGEKGEVCPSHSFKRILMVYILGDMSSSWFLTGILMKKICHRGENRVEKGKFAQATVSNGFK